MRGASSVGAKPAVVFWLTPDLRAVKAHCARPSIALPRSCSPRTQRACAAAVACGTSRADRAGGSVRHTSEPQPLNFAGPPAVRFPALMVSVSVCSGTAVAVPLNVTRVSAYGSEHE